MKAYGAKRTYADCRTSKRQGSPVKVAVGSPKNRKRERAEPLPNPEA